MTEFKDTTCPATGRPCRRGCFRIGPDFCDDPPGPWWISPAAVGVGLAVIISPILWAMGLR